MEDASDVYGFSYSGNQNIFWKTLWCSTSCNYRLDYTKVPINPILKCSIEIILSNHSYLQARVKMFAVTPIGFVNFRLELWLDYSTQVSVTQSENILIPSWILVFSGFCVYGFVCVQCNFSRASWCFLKTLPYFFFDHLQLIMEVSIKAPVSDISPGSPSHAVAFCVFNQFQGCPAETYLTLQSKWTHFNKDLYK